MGKIRILMIGSLACFVGCATIMRGTYQSVLIETEPSGAQVTIDYFQKYTTPVNVKLKRNQSHVVSIEKTGYKPTTEYLQCQFNVGSCILNNLLISSFYVDLFTGAYYDLKPDHLYVNLQKISEELISAEPEKRYERPKEIIKSSLVTSPPNLAFIYSLIDQNNDKILDGGERVSLKVKVKNQGEGDAQGVKVLLSGESKALNYLGKEKYIGDIPAGGEKEAVFEVVLPYQVEADEGDIVIKVTEERGFGSLEVKKLRVAIQPARETVVTEVVSTIVDVDQPLSPSSFRREDAYAVIIGISDYRSPKIPKVKYAKRDAETVREYLIDVCGIPSENIMMLTDEKAALSDLTAYIEEWLARNVTKNSFVFVYFAGHGTPNPEKGDAYLVPYDGEPGFIKKLYPLSQFYHALEQLPTNNIVVALDACFSGAGGRSVIEEGKRPLVAVKLPQITKKAVVITASDANEISQDLDTKRHGLFTYYFLKGLRGEADVNGDTWITIGELYNYCKPEVTRESRRLGYTQTPKVLPEPLGEKANSRIGKIK